LWLQNSLSSQNRIIRSNLKNTVKYVMHTIRRIIRLRCMTHPCINVSPLHEFRVKGVSGGLELCHFPARKVPARKGVEMQVLVRISPIILLPNRFRVKPYPSEQNKGDGNLPPKGLVRGPVCWAKMVHFWKPWKHAFWPPPECQEPFSMLPRHALSSFMVWNAGVGPWWAVSCSSCSHNISFIKRELFSFIIIKAIRPSHLPKPCTLCSSHEIELFTAKIERFPGPPPPPPGPPS